MSCDSAVFQPKGGNHRSIVEQGGCETIIISCHYSSRPNTIRLAHLKVCFTFLDKSNKYFISYPM